jgi:periplasmic protein CpxP/Spy
MTTKLRLTAIAGIITLSGLAVATTFAQDGAPRGGPGMQRRGPGGPGGPGGPMGLLGDLGRGLRALDLTDAQREQVRGIAKSHETGFRELGERLRTARQGLEALVTDDTVDETAIRAKSGELAAVEADAAVMRAKVHQEVFSILTAEQQTKARELRAEREARMKERMERRQQRPQGGPNRF